GDPDRRWPGTHQLHLKAHPHQARGAEPGAAWPRRDHALGALNATTGWRCTPRATSGNFVSGMDASSLGFGKDPQKPDDLR
ncbi:hypothetical protein, partial [Xanthomonas cerealis]|uniref:hypothetical protein n=1 Tax=Xanthomonas cerealis TaxID=3390025 RepID=UPI001C4011BA